MNTSTHASDADMSPPEPGNSFPVVGLGASAGGVQALSTFFEHVPEKSGMAYVVILHLSPEYESHLAQVLQLHCAIPVSRVTEKVPVEPDHVYVISPDHYLTMVDGHIEVSPNVSAEARRAPVDIFFRTLGEARGPMAICVILSGTGANGSLGLKHVKECGGAVFVQEPAEAEWSEMPRNAIATDLVDDVLPVAAIPARITAYKEGIGRVEIPAEAKNRSEEQQRALNDILTQLRLRTGHDFSNYKRPTLMRRLGRRISVHALSGLEAYAEFCHAHPEETQALLKDLLISVTSFYRDSEPFKYLRESILPRIFAGKGQRDQVRIWSVGCATGEEAYSLALLCADRGLGAIDAPKIQIFATDIDSSAIAKAREGCYTSNVLASVPSEQVHRFFTQKGEDFLIRREIREMVLFAEHNILRDPAFAHIDLIACRNLLIYLEPLAQERILETLHFALKSNGYLFLGTSETIESASELYTVVNREHHIFQRRATVARQYPIPEVPVLSVQHLPPAPPESRNRKTDRIGLGELHLRLLEQYAPPSLIANEEYEIVHLSERAGRYLVMPGGEPSSNLLKLIRPEFRLELRNALYQAAQRKTNVEASSVRARTGDLEENIRIHVRPASKEFTGDKGFFLVLFEQGSSQGADEERVHVSDEPVVAQLEQEQGRLKAELRATTEQYELQAEELKASNEELQAVNEELRSAAEELETSREELQSINEELTTVNQELKVKIEEVSQTSNNLQNLINATDIGTIFLDRAFHVQLFSPAARQIFNFLGSDVGRLLSDITHKLDYNHLLEDAAAVMNNLQTIEREVRTLDGRDILMRLLPYRTSDDHIQGVVATFLDITKNKQAEKLLRENDRRKDEFLAMLAHELRNPLATIRSGLEVLRLKKADDPSMDSIGDMMRRQVDHLVRLVDDLLDVSRIGSGKINLQFRPVDIRTILSDSAEAAELLMRERSHQFSLDLGPEALFVKGDADRLFQVLSNLLSNAAKYTDPGGRIHAGLGREGNHAVIRIQDTGRGIALAELERVFDLFSQVSSHEPVANGGLGIGLSLVRTLVGMHGGKVWAESPGSGKGSTFIIELPLAAGKEGAGESPEAVAAAGKEKPGSTSPVLVVDDNADGARMFTMMLEASGQQAEMALSGREAIEKARKTSYRIVFLDIGMPEMDGFETARNLRALPSCGKTILVALTGWGRESDRQRTKEAGFDSHLVKPVDRKAVVELLKKYGAGEEGTLPSSGSAFFHPQPVNGQAGGRFSEPAFRRNDPD